MDLCGDDEISFKFRDIDQCNTCLPASIRVSGIHRAALQGDLRNVKRFIESGASVNKTEVQCNFSPLHLAVIKNDWEIIDYLLARDDIELDTRCSKGKTPLNMAAELDYIESMVKLIQAGCDVNISDWQGNSPLHLSAFSPDTCHLLIRHGARIDAVNTWGYTPMHEAVQQECMEVVHMLLYYNADANVPDNYGLTPFMMAIMCRNISAHEALLEYVDDFNRTNRNSINFASTLSLALHSNSPFIKDVVERGADVNYGDESDCSDAISAFSACLLNPVDVCTFKLVWERLRYNHAKNTIELLGLLNYRELVPTFLQVIIESDNFEVAVEFFSKGENYLSFVNRFAEWEFELEQLTVLTCRLLQYGYRATSYDIYMIFYRYGYCELFRMLLYMDVDCTRGWPPCMALPRLIFDIDYAVDEINDITRENIAQLLEYSTCAHLINTLTVKYSDDEDMRAILGRLPRVPSLIELARNAVRKHIRRSLNNANTCQFYTAVNYLNIPSTCKNILTFQRKIYRVKPSRSFH